MKNEIVHLGNHNLKSSILHCGIKAYIDGEYTNSSVIPNKVTCIPCIMKFLGKQKYPNSKSNQWYRRLGDLNESAAIEIKEQLTTSNVGE